MSESSAVFPHAWVNVSTILRTVDVNIEPGRVKSQLTSMTVIEIRPHRWGWKVFEAIGVEPVFGTKDQAIGYAETRACFRCGEIRILGLTGKVERTIPFSEADRKL